MEIIKVLAKILTNILTALYEPFGFSLLLSFLAMFFYLYAYEPIHAGKGWKNAIVTWYKNFKESVLGFCDLTYSVPNPVKSEPVDESFIRCHGRLGNLGDSEWRAKADNRMY